MAIQFASRLALIAFATVSLRGVLVGGQFEGTLKTALVAGVVFYFFGMICGDLARRIVEEDARAEVEKMLKETMNEASNETRLS